MIVNRDDAEAAAKELLVHALFLQGITAEQVNEAYRSRARETHPDMDGGDAAQFAAVDRAKHVLQHWLKRTPDARPADLTAGLCEPCGGTGYIKRRAGFSSGLRQQCVRCKGTGDTNYDHEKAFE